MPIKPENMGKYPGGSTRSKEWLAIRAGVLEAAKNRCQQCGVLNHCHVICGAGHDAGTFMYGNGCLFSDKDGRPLGVVRGSEYDGDRVVKIILTIAHLDHDPGNNDPGNLKALCQLCHCRHDVEHRKQTRAATARAKLATGDLFDHHHEGKTECSAS